MPTIQAKEYLVRQIFSNEYAFTIPRYQRPYSWGLEQAEELFRDLVEASAGFVPGDSKRQNAPYFLGSIVLIKNDQKPDSEVIDGQQRLTTLALLLSALRVAFDDEKRKKTFAAFLFEEGDSIVGTKDRCRLIIRERDHTFFEANVLRHGTLDHFAGLLAGALPDPQKKIATNCARLVELVKGLSPEARDSLAAFLVQQTYLVVVSTPDLDSAFRIFSVMNDRGLDLTVADILKAEVIGKISSTAEQDAYGERWEDAEAELGTTRFAELFSHIRMIYGRSKLRKTVLQGFRESVTSINEPKKFIDQELLPYADAYAQILDANFESAKADLDEKINWHLRLLHRMGDTDWIPATLQFIRQNQNDPAKILTFIQDMERLAASLWITRADVTARIDRHGLLLKAIGDKSNLSDPASPLQLSAEEKANVLRLLAGNIYEMTPKPKRTMILLRLDDLLSSHEASYQVERITVEHVLPQTPPADSEWIKWWPDAADRDRVVHTLGNLALLNRSQNSAAKNWDFEKKKKGYFDGKTGASPFVITTEVLRAKTWEPHIYVERQDRFLATLSKAWRLE